VERAGRKLTLSEKNQLETIPSAIEKIESVIGKLKVRLADPDLYSRDRKAFDEAGALLARAEGELARLEERWLELELIREQGGA
jgi:ATP-binding cassette subfamily F protein uup